MAPKKVTSVDVEKGRYVDYLKKALQFFNVMKMCLQDGEWDAVLLNGIHASISINDALTIFRLGKRSSGKSHQEATLLLNQVVSGQEEGRKNVARLSQILDSKNIVEYDSRRFNEKEARYFAQQVERFVEWVQRQLPP